MVKLLEWNAAAKVLSVLGIEWTAGFLTVNPTISKYYLILHL